MYKKRVRNSFTIMKSPGFQATITLERAWDLCKDRARPERSELLFWLCMNKWHQCFNCKVLVKLRKKNKKLSCTSLTISLQVVCNSKCYLFTCRWEYSWDARMTYLGSAKSCRKHVFRWFARTSERHWEEAGSRLLLPTYDSRHPLPRLVSGRIL